MVVATMTWELRLPGCRSLKEKRMVVRSLRERLRRRFNVSVAETAWQDVHDRAELTAALVAGDRRFADSVLSRMDDLVAADGRALVVGARSEFL
ncbi:MAG: DUF503 domain-containing protein [Gemmatimonadetes bacterium]|nr:MAG: DUF503 domain-containing protein [Gemmatimonadota bacterium]